MTQQPRTPTDAPYTAVDVELSGGAAMTDDSREGERAAVEARWAEWIVRQHPAAPDKEADGRLGPRVYDWACAECTVGHHLPPTVPGFRCVPHDARAILAALRCQSDGQGWPCDAEQMRRERDAAVRLLREAHRGDWCQLPGGVWNRIDALLTDSAAQPSPDARDAESAP